ncbi:MAG: type II toxin-antitoxin system RelE/ParE family toxin [Calditrichaeota bacterium]|nr:type II toxin-antitoxin system RelE/ParE family toxin [Calditrichota bacterium]
MNYKLLYSRKFKSDLSKVQTKDKARVKNRLIWLAENVHTIKHTPLRAAELKGTYRLRISNWRIFYKFDHKISTIYILSIKDRKEAYR